MFRPFRQRACYVLPLWREGLLGGWVGALYAVATLYVFVRDDWWRPTDDAKYKIAAMIPHLSLPWWLCGWLLILLFWLFEASFRVKSRLDAQLAELQKIGPKDLQILLGGVFSGSEFIYSSHVTHVCRRYEPGFDMQSLSKGYDVVSVRAPTNSIARLHFQFLHSRLSTGGYQFFVKDEQGTDRAVEIYDGPATVMLNSLSQFALRLECADDFDLEKASLVVSVTSWLK